MTLRLRVERKGYIILFKAIREAAGIDEVEVRDGILLKPVRRVDREKLRDDLKEHLYKLRSSLGLVESELSRGGV